MKDSQLFHGSFSHSRSLPASPAAVFAAFADTAVRRRWFQIPSEPDGAHQRNSAGETCRRRSLRNNRISVAVRGDRAGGTDHLHVGAELVGAGLPLLMFDGNRKYVYGATGL